MSTTMTETKRLEHLEDELRSNALEMTSVIAQRLSYFRRIAMRRLNSAADAEDAVQDALLSAWKHLDQFRGQARMSTWLTAIVMNSSRQIVRKGSRVHLLSIDDQEEGEKNVPFSELLSDRQPDPEAQLRKSEYKRRLHSLSALLPPGLRVVIHKQIVEGLSVREVAEALGLTESAVKNRAARARAELRRLDQHTPGSMCAQAQALRGQ